MRRIILAVLAAATFLIGTAGVADAMRDPFPTCIRECSPIPPIIVCVTEPCPSFP